MRHLAWPLLCVSLSTPFSATAEEWVNLASSDRGATKFDAQPGSFRITTNRSGKAIAVINGRMVDTKSSRIEIYQWYVAAEDCAAKMGKLVSLDTRGEFQFDSDFMLDSGNVASIVAGVICTAADQEAKETVGKGL
ncbi:hypothetical protein [Pseudomonas sp. W03]|uniref:hypothetical protein n=1 Tax=Pseudomonas sp. W03 TaxID=3090666 RepID=UPI003A4E01F5